MPSILSLLVPAAGAMAATSVYGPVTSTCPSDTLVRSADGISTSEESYIASRKANADAALQSWLASALPEVSTSSLPTIALSTSGGGFRSLLSGAGVIQALDARDSNTSVSGLYQAITYQAALSGGAWLLSSLAAGNWPTVSSLQTGVWETQFAGGILDSSLAATVADYTEIVVDIATKGALGFPVSLTDPWGRMVAYQIMEGGEGAMDVTLSDLTTFSNFTSYNVPFPIITATQINATLGECEPTAEEAIYEFNPFEFGSWSDDISSFVQTKYLGSSFDGGVAAECSTGFDNINWVMGTSSNLLNTYICEGVDIVDEYFPSAIITTVEKFTSTAEYGYSLIPNPFLNFNSTTLSGASSVATAETLHLVDGGESLDDHNVPILPLLEPTRNISVIIVNDNSNDVDGFPDGASLVSAWDATQTGRLAGRFPQVPAAGSFSTQKAQFFGCDDADAATVIYLPNAAWTYASNTSTLQLAYTASETESMVSNGNSIATQGDDESWASCLACGIMLKEVGSANLPSECSACLTEYCWSA